MIDKKSTSLSVFLWLNVTALSDVPIVLLAIKEIASPSTFATVSSFAAFRIDALVSVVSPANKRTSPFA